jgi:adenine-specific DNA-methyltransferase
MMTVNLRKENSEPAAGAPSNVLFSISPVTEKINRFPTTRYYGSKRKLLPWLFDCMKLIEFDTVLDAFGGTGSVSQLFRAMRKQVTYHDAFSFNSDIARAILTDSPQLSEADLASILSGIKPKVGTVATVFEGVFFPSEENQWIDGFMHYLQESDVAEPDRALLLYLLYQACLKKRPFNLFHRANLGVRTNVDVKRSFGNLTTWENSFEEHMSQAYGELSSLRSDRLRAADILPAGDVADIPAGFDLVYLDPPYVSTSERTNRDNYWLRYHFLEGLSNYVAWPERISHVSKIRQMIEPPHFTEWSRRRTFKEKLFSLVEKHRHSIVVLSYVKNAYPTDVEIREFFEATFARVSVHSTEHSHALSASKKRELLFVGAPA